MAQKTVLLVEDSKLDREIIKANVTNGGFDCLLATDGIEALHLLKTEKIDIVVSDQSMPKLDGIQLLNKKREAFPDIPFIMLTGEGTVDDAVLSLKRGANDYLQKPSSEEELINAINRALDYHKLEMENRVLRNALSRTYGLSQIVTQSAAMRKTIAWAEKVAECHDVTVALLGESGVGKEVIARAIHAEGGGLDENFVAVNCAGIPELLIESELFGYTKGSFTGAEKDKKGKFDHAQDGTVMLDEIGDLPLGLQGKLLRVLQERSYERVGSNEKIEANFRFIAATHRNLEEMVKKGTFRSDLFHRIMTYPITIPPLRERPEDISGLARLFLDSVKKSAHKQDLTLADSTLEALNNYHWPGNVRELRNCVERAAILTDGNLITPDRLQFVGAPDEADVGESGERQANAIHFDFTLSCDEASFDNISARIKEIVLKKCGGNKKRAAQILKKDRSIFYPRH